jgi:hypothetical protein
MHRELVRPGIVCAPGQFERSTASHKTMNRIIAAFIILVALSLLAFAQQTQPCSATKDVRIVKDKPTIYITFESFGKAINLPEQKLIEQSKSASSKEQGQDIWLRIHNNTCWQLKFIQFGLHLPKQKANENPGERFKRLGILDDGDETGLFYTVVKADGKSFYVGIDSYDYVTLQAGNSLLFSVAREHLSKGQSVQVRFYYQWEFQPGQVTNEPEHKIEFRRFDLEEQTGK